jgi:hypothetical protein
VHAGTYLLSTPCWTCQGRWCQLRGADARLGNVGTASNITTRVSVQGGGSYKLAYTVTHDFGTPNAWRVVVGSVDGSFSSSVLESLTDAPAIPSRYTEQPFNVPAGTTAITLTFSGRQVRVSPPLLTISSSCGAYEGWRDLYLGLLL